METKDDIFYIDTSLSLLYVITLFQNLYTCVQTALFDNMQGMIAFE